MANKRDRVCFSRRMFLKVGSTAAVAAVAASVGGYFAYLSNQAPRTKIATQSPSVLTPTETPTPTPRPAISTPLPTPTPTASRINTVIPSPVAEEKFKPSVEVVAENLEIPWSMAFAPDGRLFFTERPGRIGLIEGGEVLPEPIGKLDVAQIAESGLLGLALHPSFPSDNRLYVQYTMFDSGRLKNRVSSFRFDGRTLSQETVVVDGIPGAQFHNGGRIRFGPDGKLYITTGDAGDLDAPQNLESLAGKILRVNPDGTIPDDNPFAGSPVFSLGHRNPQGLDWHPATGDLYISEHGPRAHDEVNLIEPGENYGWPDAFGEARDSRFVAPLIQTGDTTWAPSGASFYRGDKLSAWKSDLFIATLRGVHLRRIILSPPTYRQVEFHEPLFVGEFGRLRDVAEGPDGFLYICTNNRDGRGSPAANDDRILKIKPSN